VEIERVMCEIWQKGESDMEIERVVYSVSDMEMERVIWK